MGNHFADRYGSSEDVDAENYFELTYGSSEDKSQPNHFREKYGVTPVSDNPELQAAQQQLADARKETVITSGTGPFPGIGMWAQRQVDNLTKGFELADAHADIANNKAVGNYDKGAFTRMGEALPAGWDNMVGSLELGRFALSGGEGDVTEMAAKLDAKIAQNAERAKNRTPGEAGVYGALEGVNESKGFMGFVGSGVRAAGEFFGNPGDAAVISAEQAANSVPSLGMGLAGAGAGAVVGGVPGAIVGGRSGMATGTVATEFGAELEEAIVDHLGAEGVNAPDRAQRIAAILSDPAFMSEAKVRAAKKGLTVAAMDQVFMTLGGKIASKPGIGSKVGAVTIDSAGEGISDYTAQFAATGEADAGEALLESLASGPTSIVDAGVGYASETYKSSPAYRRQQILKQLERSVDATDIGGGADAAAVNSLRPDVGPEFVDPLNAARPRNDDGSPIQGGLKTVQPFQTAEMPVDGSPVPFVPVPRTQADEKERPLQPNGSEIEFEKVAPQQTKGAGLSLVDPNNPGIEFTQPETPSRIDELSAGIDREIKTNVDQQRASRLPSNLPDQRLNNPAYRSELERSLSGLETQHKNMDSKVVEPKTDDLFAAIAKLGGVNRAELEADGFDKADLGKHKLGIRPVFHKNGKSVDDMAEALVERGYLQERDVDALKEMIHLQLAGDEQFSPAGIEHQMDQAQQVVRAKALGVPPMAAHKAITKALKGEKLGKAEVEIVKSALGLVGEFRGTQAAEVAADRQSTNEQRKVVREGIANIERADDVRQHLGSVPFDAQAYAGQAEAAFEADDLPSYSDQMEAAAVFYAQDAGVTDEIISELELRYSDTNQYIAALYRAAGQVENAGQGKDSENGSKTALAQGTGRGHGRSEADTGKPGDGRRDTAGRAERKHDTEPKADRQQGQPRLAAPAAKVIGFKTSKGSEYTVHEDGTTTRNKAARNDPGHEGDTGTKKQTAKTVYVDANASVLSAAGLSNLGEKGARVAIKDGRATLLTWNGQQGRWGASASGRGIPVHNEPAVGRYPLELWKPANDVPGYEAYRGMHAGNQITEVSGEDNSEPIFGSEADELLSDYTEEDLQKQAKEKAARQKAEADEKAKAEAKGKADSEAGTFQLTGSDRQSDANPNQNDMFDAPKEGGRGKQPSVLDSIRSKKNENGQYYTLTIEGVGEYRASHSDTGIYIKWISDSGRRNDAVLNEDGDFVDATEINFLSGESSERAFTTKDNALRDLIARLAIVSRDINVSNDVTKQAEQAIVDLVLGRKTAKQVANEFALPTNVNPAQVDLLDVAADKESGGTKAKTESSSGTVSDDKSGQFKSEKSDIPLLPGDRFTTESGRVTSPLPKAINHKNMRGEIAMREWLKSEALAEAEAKGDKFNATQWRALNPKNWSQADGDLVNLYLFGDETGHIGARKVGQTANNKPETKAKPENAGAAGTSSSDLVEAYIAGKTDTAPTVDQVKKELEGKGAIDSIAGSIDAEIDSVAAELAALLKAQLNQANSGVDPKILALGAKLGALYVSKGVVKFAQYAQAIINKLREMGVDADQVKPMLKEFYGATQAQVTDELFEQMDDMRTVRAFDLGTIKASETKPVSEGSKLSLSDFIYKRLESISDNRALKSALSEYYGIPSSSVTDAQMKKAQETMELALVRQARDIVSKNASDKETFDALLAAYKNQPNLNIRSSTSMMNQAYSTPAPIAFLASRMAGIGKASTVYEPTAGNGMLLIGASPESTLANEIDAFRASQLKQIGFQVTEEDATTNNPGAKKYDSVIMNPPFGKLRNDDGSLSPVKYDGYTIKSIDQLIAAKALEAMKDDGGAVLIIGADKEPGEIGSSDRVFFNWLYSHYNVTGHFEIDGKLYSRQGAGWPIRVIIINGRAESSALSPKSGSIERFNNWNDIYEHYQQSLDSAGRFIGSGTESVGDSSERRSSDDAGDSALVSGGKAGKTDQGGRKLSPRNTGNSAGLDKRNTDAPREKSGNRTDVHGQPELLDKQIGNEAEKNDAEESGAASGSKSEQPSVRPNDKPKPVSKGSSYQSTYHARSKGFNDSVLTPNNMAEPLQAAFDDIQKDIGDIDTYVKDKLGYASVEAMHKAFMGLQIDAVAATIYNFEKKNKGVIIADQTGVGKGRQAAAIIRYAIREGKIPVFVTVTENLFTDMYDDLADIGSNNVAPLILNAGSGIIHKDAKLFQTKDRASVFGEVIKNRALPHDRNAVFMTYSQINTPNLQRELVAAIRNDAIFILDESHNAAGEQTILKKTGPQRTAAGFINDLIEGKPVLYLSATFAKRPDNMPVYYRTDLMDAVDKPSQLIDAIASGGVPLQTAMSGMLARSGQLIRRERSFEGISIPIVFDQKNKAIHADISDKVTSGLRAITNADHYFHHVFLENYKESVADLGIDIAGAGNKASSTIDHNNFNAVVHNYVRQLLLSLKAEEAASKAIAAFKAGKKPVIALENTMGAFLTEFAKDAGLNAGDVVDADYRDVMRRALDRTRRLTKKDEMGNSTIIDIPMSMLDPITKEAYREAYTTIDSLDLQSFPISPIDYMRKQLISAGLSVAELTGRDLLVDYSGAEPVLAKRPANEKNKRQVVDRFNAGTLDALIINRSGSTGLSIHASEKFKDQRPRHMIVAQTMLDVNILVQMLGRINRTGQIELPTYEIMGLDIPAEKRPLASSAKKLKSLNANTSANEESDTSLNAPDIYNKYGDQIVSLFLAENPEIGRMVDMAGAEDGTAFPDTALKFTGRMALLPVKMQEEIYSQIEPAYEAKIDYLTKTGQNDLIAQTLDTDAKIKASVIVYEGKNPGTIFGANTTLHKVDIKYQGKPPTSDEVRSEVKKALGSATPDSYTQSIIDRKQGDEDRMKAEIQKRIQKTQREFEEYEQKPNATKEKAQSLRFAAESVATLEVKYADHVRSSKESIKKFYPGSLHELDLGDDVVIGAVVGISDSHKSIGDPWAASKIGVRFMINSGVRAITIPLAQLSITGTIHKQIMKAGTYESVFDNHIDSNAREIRYVATGNLIAGSAKLSGGRITNITDDKGRTHQVILMPKRYGKEGEFDGAEDSSNFSVRDAAVAAKFLKMNEDKIEFAGGLFSATQSVRITRNKRGWVVQVAKANKDEDARNVKFDPALIKITGDFYGAGQVMSAYFNESALSQVVSRVIELTPLYALPSMRDAWVLAGGAKAAEAQASFDDINKTSVKESEAVYSTDERETSNIQERKRRASGYNEAQHDLFSPANVPAEVAGVQARDNIRVHYKQVAVGTIQSGIDTVKSASDAAHVFAAFRKHAQETMLALVTDQDGKVLNLIRHTKGLKDSSAVSVIELVAAAAATPGGKNLWLGHNHPSGATMPSSGDKAVTARINAALKGTDLLLRSHIVVGPGKYFDSMDRFGSDDGARMPVGAAARKKTIEITERVLRRRDTEPAEVMNSPTVARRFITELEAENAVILMDTQNRVVGEIAMTHEEMRALINNRQVTRILTAIDRANASAIIIKSSDRDAADNVSNFISSFGDLRMLDVFTGTKAEGFISDATQGTMAKGGVFFSKSATLAKGKTKKGMRPEHVQKIAEDFLAKFIGADDGLKVRLSNSVADEFGAAAAAELGIVKGAYYPGSNEVVLITSELVSAQDVIKTLQHEILVHKGLGLFAPAVREQIISAVLEAAAQSPSLAPIWERIQTDYKGEKDMVKAEEVIAAIAERRLSKVDRFINKMLIAFRKALAAIGWAKPGISNRDLIEMLYQMGDAFKEGKKAGRRTDLIKRMNQDGRMDSRSSQTGSPEFKKAGKTVGGLLVRDSIPNRGSIESSLSDYTALDGVREVPYSAFTQLGELSYYSASEERRTKRLAEEIKQSGEINPLIVVVDSEGPYILEGGHRFDALRELGKASFPAMVVLDNDSLPDKHDQDIYGDAAENKGPLYRRSSAGGLPDPKSREGRIAAFFDGITHQPIDRMLRLPFDALGIVDTHGRVKGGMKLEDGAAHVIKEWRPFKGRFEWMDNIIEAARHGLIDRYKLSDEFVQTYREAQAFGRKIDMKALDMLEALEKRGLTQAEAHSLQAMLTGERLQDKDIQELGAPILEAIDQLGMAAVQYGIITREQFERNRGAYLHRSYLKHEGDKNSVGKWMLNRQLSKAKKIAGKTSKGRGIKMNVDMNRLLAHVPTDWYGIKQVNGKADRIALHGRKFIMLENPGVVLTHTDTLEGFDSAQAERVTGKGIVYWPADIDVPAKYEAYKDRGTFEVTGSIGNNITLWRDYTKAERVGMGEILDARYNIAKTFTLLSHDIAMGKFYQDIARNDEWFQRELPPGIKALSGHDANKMHNLSVTDWVQVPDTSIAGSPGIKRWGALAGGYVRSEIWRDLNELDRMSQSNAWDKVMTQWKVNKTARSPVTHMNNVMSNLIWMDLADVRMTDLVTGIVSYKKRDQHWRDAQEHGAFEGTFANEEMRKQIMEPILDKLVKEQMSAAPDTENTAVQLWKFASVIWHFLKKVDQALVSAYQIEDELFRMATYMRRINLGDDPKEAARISREQFIDYDIHAPWVNVARRYPLPFIGYTYRAVPLLAKAIIHRPWKLAKYVALAHAAVALGYMMAPGDDDEEERTMREDQQGKTIFGTPRMMRLPYRDEFGNPMFIDVRRWIPAGDLFDMNQASSAIPTPAWLQFGGPLMIAAELALNHQGFVDKEIVNADTDTGMEAGSKVIDYLYKSWMPSAAYIPGSYYWDKAKTAWNGGRDVLGRPYSFPQALLSSVGIKVQPHDVELGYAFRSRDLAAQARMVQGDIRRAALDYNRDIISDSEYEKTIESSKAKLERLAEKQRELRGD